MIERHEGCLNCGTRRDVDLAVVYLVPGYRFKPCELGYEAHEWGEILTISTDEPLTLAR